MKGCITGMGVGRVSLGKGGNKHERNDEIQPLGE